MEKKEATERQMEAERFRLMFWYRIACYDMTSLLFSVDDQTTHKSR